MKRGDIFLFNLREGVGHEQSGSRPGILISKIINGMLLVVPLTSNLEALRFSYTLNIAPSIQNGLISKSVALVFQIKSLDKKRAVKQIGCIDASGQKELNKLLEDLL